MKDFFILLVISAVCASTVFVGSFVTADRTKYHNNFVRVFPSHVLKTTAAVELSAKRFSVAGMSNFQIFIRDRVNGGVLVLKPAMMDTTRVHFNIPRESEMTVDSPDFFLENGNRGELQQGNIQSWRIDTTFNLSSGFTALQPISPNIFALRTIDLQRRKNVFVNSNSPLDLKDILEKQVDGILCTDGYLLYSKPYCMLIYLYRYRNQFLCMDTAFNVQLVGNTIDTTSVAKISVGEINGEIKMSKPPLIVNKGAFVHGKYLFVRSNLVASNESTEMSKMNSTIDVYNILDGSYMFSFYIPDQANSKVQSFRVNGNLLIATFQNHLVRYDLSSDYFQF